ncbi:hypothetical protein MMAN_35810 [Mycobacterium mantenii]|uniref:PE domain-containing protein n=1 Tax=Mycobacterium mantenii TaxID=560555 RepID=A0ABM7JV49_MYCNT|nr:hypothetical protein MMAN_35810 [Mycobacterium mantenii]
MPDRSDCQPVPVRWKISMVAFEPPVLTTETTWVASPTAFANQGAPAAALIGDSTTAAKITHAAAHSEVSSRCMHSIVEQVHLQGQVKL